MTDVSSTEEATGPPVKRKRTPKRKPDETGEYRPGRTRHERWVGERVHASAWISPPLHEAILADMRLKGLSLSSTVSQALAEHYGVEG
jgi:hypothetical protein